jgi:YfiH family protein
MNADCIVPEWRGPARAAALFTTRSFGDVGEARRRLRDLLPSDPVWLSQVHGRTVVRVDADNVMRYRATPPQADAAVTRVPGVVLTVRTADCLPVLFADRGATVIGVAHAGWRGLAAGVLEATVDALDASDIVAWIGPAIGAQAFEVGRDVYDAFCASDPACIAHFLPVREGKWLADLPALARLRLAAAGITAVDGGAWCTHRDPQRFFSYRRDKSSARMALCAWLR